jgi:hypothetical protein
MNVIIMNHNGKPKNLLVFINVLNKNIDVYHYVFNIIIIINY